MAHEERDITANRILFNISIITGWTVPASDFMMNLLVEQFAKKLEESYANVNEQEMEYAFRNKGLEIKDWGKALNLALIDEVMIPYLNNRFDISRQEEKIGSQTAMMQIEQHRENTEKEWSDWINECRNYSFNLIPNEIYDYLEKTKKLVLSIEQKHDLMEKAIGYITANIDPTSTGYKSFLEQKSTGIWKDGDSLGTIKTYAKKFAVKKYLDETKPAE